MDIRQEISREEVLEGRLISIELVKVDGPLILRKGNKTPSHRWDVKIRTADNKGLSPAEHRLVGKIVQDVGYKLRHMEKSEFQGPF